MLIDADFWVQFIIANGLLAFLAVVLCIVALAVTIVFFICWFINCSVEEEWQSPLRYLLDSTEWMWRKKGE